MKKQISVVCPLLFALVGCLGQPPDNGDATGSPTVEFATETVVASESLPETESPGTPVAIACIEPSTIIPTNFRATGGVLLASDSYSDSFYYDLETQVMVSLPREEKETLSNFAVSPDRKWVAYELHSSTSPEWLLVVTSSPDERELIIQPDASWRWVVEWLDNQYLLISNRSVDELAL